MASTLSIIKADVGSIGGHVAPSKELMDTVSRTVAQGLDAIPFNSTCRCIYGTSW